MSITKDSIKNISETVGIKNLNDQVSNALASDVEYRIRELIQEALKFMKHSKRNKLTTEDVNHALRLRDMEALYGFSSKDPLQYFKMKGTQDTFYEEDKELEFSEIINAPLPKCPRDPHMRVHWLAIEGVQPAIPQNPIPQTQESHEQKKRKEPSSSSVIVKPLVKHVLSKELQLYFEKTTSAIKSGVQQSVNASIQSLTNDPGLHQLMPYFAQFISEEVTKNLRNLSLLKDLMRMLRALLESPYLHVDPYLHQLMPALLTCLVGKRLCEKIEEDHWELRNYCANLLAYLCKRYGDSYENLQARITKTLLQAFLDPNKALTTHYGAIVGMTALGHHVIQLLLLPNIGAYMKLLEPELNSPNFVKKRRSKEMSCCSIECCWKILKSCIKRDNFNWRKYNGSNFETNSRET